MRKYVLILFVSLLALPAVGAAALSRGVGDGTLSVEEGQGRIVIDVSRGGVIGRFDRGFVTILDRTPDDAFVPKVWGAAREVEIGTGERHYGPDVRFRLIGGSFRIVINGAGIDLSAVGSGVVSLEGNGRFPGVYSLDGEDCSVPRSTCKALPDEAQRFRLGTAEPPERESSRPSP